MTRLDDLLALRRNLDVEIQRERASEERIKQLRSQVLSVSSRGSWNERVLVITCHHFAIDEVHVTGGSRDRNAVNARHTAMWLMRDAGRSYPEIGTEFGMDHTSVMYAIRRLEGNAQLLAGAHAIREQLIGDSPEKVA